VERPQPRACDGCELSAPSLSLPFLFLLTARSCHYIFLPANVGCEGRQMRLRHHLAEVPHSYLGCGVQTGIATMRELEVTRVRV
jgi:hypothetical protein